MKKQKSLIVLIAIIATIIIPIITFYEEMDYYADDNDDTVWVHSGPFSIDREEYWLGHKIFLVAEGIDENDKGSIILTRINDDGSEKLWKKYNFNGAKKSGFNIYFSPVLDETRNFCTVEELIGNYKIIFENTEYEDIELKIIHRYLPGMEERFEPIC